MFYILATSRLTMVNERISMADTYEAAFAIATEFMARYFQHYVRAVIFFVPQRQQGEAA